MYGKSIPVSQSQRASSGLKMAVRDKLVASPIPDAKHIALNSLWVSHKNVLKLAEKVVLNSATNS